MIITTKIDLIIIIVIIINTTTTTTTTTTTNNNNNNTNNNNNNDTNNNKIRITYFDNYKQFLSYASYDHHMIEYVTHLTN